MDPLQMAGLAYAKVVHVTNPCVWYWDTIYATARGYMTYDQWVSNKSPIIHRCEPRRLIVHRENNFSKTPAGRLRATCHICHICHQTSREPWPKLGHEQPCPVPCLQVVGDSHLGRDSRWKPSNILRPHGWPEVASHFSSTKMGDSRACPRPKKNEKTGGWLKSSIKGIRNQPDWCLQPYQKYLKTSRKEAFLRPSQEQHEN